MKLINGFSSFSPSQRASHDADRDNGYAADEDTANFGRQNESAQRLGLVIRLFGHDLKHCHGFNGFIPSIPSPLAFWPVLLADSCL